MIIETITGIDIDNVILREYFKSLINLFFKILPMKENREVTLITYMKGLQCELLGCKNVIKAINNNPLFLSLISILQYLIDFPECSIKETRREVFSAISICNKLKSIYADAEVTE